MATHGVPEPFCHGAQCQAMGIMISPAWAAAGLFFHEKKKKLNKINLFVAGFYFHQVFTGFCGGKKQAQGSFHLASDGCSSAIPQPLPQHLPFQNQSSCCSSTQSHPKPPPGGGPRAQGTAATPAPTSRAFQEHRGAFKAPKEDFAKSFCISSAGKEPSWVPAVNADCSFLIFFLFFSFLFYFFPFFFDFLLLGVAVGSRREAQARHDFSTVHFSEGS